MEKISRYINVAVVVIVGISLLCSCCRTVDIKMTVDTTPLVFDSEASSKSVSVETNADYVTCTASESWCTAVYSETTNKLTVSVIANPLPEMRSAIVTLFFETSNKGCFSSSKQKSQVSISVTQLGK